MESLSQWQGLLERVLQSYADLPYPYRDVNTYVVVGREKKHFFLMHEGWQGSKRLHGIVVHAEIREGKIWIHYDGIEDSITAELEASGVPKNKIVLAFHSPDIREHTGYAVV